MSDCLFCNIIEKKADADIVYEDEDIIAFKDINPVAPVHLLIVPRKHFDSILSIGEEDAYLVGRLHLVVNKLAGEFGLQERGFRIVINCGEEGGQAVLHLHFHLIGGKPLYHNIAKGRGV